MIQNKPVPAFAAGRLLSLAPPATNPAASDKTGYSLFNPVTGNVQLDCGGNFGGTRAADNFNPFAGITVKF
jgi:hypothetical protein